MAKTKLSEEETKIMETKQTKKADQKAKVDTKKAKVEKVATANVETLETSAKKTTGAKKVATKAEKTPKKKVETAKKKVTSVVAKQEAVAKVVKKEPAKAAAKKTVVEKSTTKKTVAKKETLKKTTTKKASATKTSAKANVIDYTNRSLEECIHILQLLGVGYEYENYVSILLEEEDVKAVCENIISGNDLKQKISEANISDYDLNIVAATIEKVMATMPVAAAQFKEMKKAVSATIKFKLGEDDQVNAKHYLDTFDLVEKILILAQRRNITTCKEAKSVTKIDVEKLFTHFFALAYDILKTWQYEDIEYYQQFAFAIVAQFDDLYNAYQNQIQMDCADLFIIKGDSGRGDYEYNYVLRENTIKDYIYYRFASVYVTIDLAKAKAIAYDSFQWVDDRYNYYAKLVEITNM